MKLLIVALLCCLAGCKSATAPATPPAPGYSSSDDQTLGQSLAALNAFVNQEKTNYATLTVTQQATEKPILNSLIDATTIANAAYVAFHQGSGTLASAQTAYASAQAKETALTAAKGVQ